MATQAERAHMKQLMKLLLDHEPQVHYPKHDIRGAADAATFSLSEGEMRSRLTTGKTLMFDCSQSTQQICRWAGLKDPCGHKYAWAGYTGDMLRVLTHYSNPIHAMVGALVVYGPGTGEHVSMVYEPGSDPLLWSHGFDGGPQLVRLSVQRTYHRTPVTFCSIAKL